MTNFPSNCMNVVSIEPIICVSYACVLLLKKRARAKRRRDARDNNQSNYINPCKNISFSGWLIDEQYSVAIKRFNYFDIIHDSLSRWLERETEETDGLQNLTHNFCFRFRWCNFRCFCCFNGWVCHAIKMVHHVASIFFLEIPHRLDLQTVAFTLATCNSGLLYNLSSYRFYPFLIEH